MNRVGEQVHQNVRKRNDQDATLQKRIVASRDGLYREAADAGPGENCLGYDGAGEEGSKLQAQNCDDGDQRVSQTVAEEHGSCAESFCARGADVIGGEFFKHCATNHARQNCSKRGPERCGRKDVAAEPTSSGYGQQTNFN